MTLKPHSSSLETCHIIKNIGLISLDIEHLDYSTMKFRNGGNGDNFSDLNTDIQNVFKSITNIKVGGEYKHNNFSFRAGYAYYPSPYRKGFINDKSNTSQISGGIGYRSGNNFNRHGLFENPEKRAVQVLQ